MSTIENITNPDQAPIDGDLIRIIDGDTVIEKLYYAVVDPTDEEIAQEARAWRDRELTATDSISQTPDHAERTAYLAYRVALRDWPEQDENGDYINGFPDTKPEL